MRTIVTLILSIVTLVPVSAQDWASVISDTLKSVVYIETDDGSCTGFIVDTKRKYVMTAAHCISKDIWLDRVEGRLVSKETRRDLAIYEVKELDPAKPALRLADDDPEVGQEVVSLGYGMGLERPMARKAMVSDTRVEITGIDGAFIGLDSAFIGGQSGGPVVNSKGEVVMIVQRASGTMGIGVAASVIREKMGRFWAK
jgi:serine protease Do